MKEPTHKFKTAFLAFQFSGTSKTIILNKDDIHVADGQPLSCDGLYENYRLTNDPSFDRLSIVNTIAALTDSNSNQLIASNSNQPNEVSFLRNVRGMCKIILNEHKKITLDVEKHIITVDQLKERRNNQASQASIEEKYCDNDDDKCGVQKQELVKFKPDEDKFKHLHKIINNHGGSNINVADILKLAFSSDDQAVWGLHYAILGYILNYTYTINPDDQATPVIRIDDHPGDRYISFIVNEKYTILDINKAQTKDAKKKPVNNRSKLEFRIYYENPQAPRLSLQKIEIQGDEVFNLMLKCCR